MQTSDLRAHFLSPLRVGNPLMTKVNIYQPRKTATQSGRGKTKEWFVEFEPQSPQKNDVLMGWIGQGDTRNQIKMRFSTREAAIEFCEKRGLDYQVADHKRRKVKPKSYSDNFAHDRDKNWTH